MSYSTGRHNNRYCKSECQNVNSYSINITRHKSSGVDEMGERLATTDMGQNWGCASLGKGELGPHVT